MTSEESHRHFLYCILGLSFVSLLLLGFLFFFSPEKPHAKNSAETMKKKDSLSVTILFQEIWKRGQEMLGSKTEGTQEGTPQ